MRITWTDTISKRGYNNYSQRIIATIGSVKCDEIIVVPFGGWSSSSTERSRTNSTVWVIIPVNATATSVSVFIIGKQTLQDMTRAVHLPKTSPLQSRHIESKCSRRFLREHFLQALLTTRHKSAKSWSFGGSS